jgi:hypothetical protein
MFDGDGGQAWSPTYADFAAAGLTVPTIPTGIEVHNPDEERIRLQAESERMLSQSEEDEQEEDIAISNNIGPNMPANSGQFFSMNSLLLSDSFADFRGRRRRVRR